MYRLRPKYEIPLGLDLTLQAGHLNSWTNINLARLHQLPALTPICMTGLMPGVGDTNLYYHSGILLPRTNGQISIYHVSKCADDAVRLVIENIAETRPQLRNVKVKQFQTP